MLRKCRKRSTTHPFSTILTTLPPGLKRSVSLITAAVYSSSFKSDGFCANCSRAPSLGPGILASCSSRIRRRTSGYTLRKK